jgi:hypothetical protein
MTRILLLGIVAIAILIIAPRVGATRSIQIDPDRSSNADSSSLLARTVFDVAEEGDYDGEDLRDRRDELREDGKLEERRDDARRWAEEND